LGGTVSVGTTDTAWIFTENWDALEWIHVRQGVERKIVLTATTTLQLMRFHPGHDINPHTHEFEQVAYILSGTLDYFVANEKGDMVAHRMVAGSTLAIPAGARHYAQNVGSEPVLNLDIYAVRRPELLPRTK
jgi:quercetin dioxygenase-like cupin family protein